MPTATSRSGIGSHQSAVSGSDVWLTPPGILAALGPFDLDPCAAPEPRPWPTAAEHLSADDDGLSYEWTGRVWLNPPYSTADPWLARLAEHGTGTALLFARTETSIWRQHIWPHATGFLFLDGRLHFHRPSGERSRENAGAPSVLIAYGIHDAQRLRTCSLPGAYLQRGDRHDPS